MTRLIVTLAGLDCELPDSVISSSDCRLVLSSLTWQSGTSPLQYATERDHWPAAHLLLQRTRPRVDKDLYKVSLLNGNHGSPFRILLDRAQNEALVARALKTPHKAVAAGAVDVATLLISRGVWTEYDKAA